MIVKLSTLLSIMDIVFTIVSMHQDMDAGRPTEVDMLSGVMRKLGQDLGVATPYNDMLYHMIKLKNKSAYCLSGSSGNFLHLLHVCIVHLIIYNFTSTLKQYDIVPLSCIHHA